MISELLRKSKSVAVWGLGYLGYTTILELQEHGFSITVHDLHDEPMECLVSGRYPLPDVAKSWSDTGYTPPVDFSTVTVARDPVDMFQDAAVHLVAIPLGYSPTENRLGYLAEQFAKGIPTGGKPQTVVFLSAHVPGNIDRHFVDLLESKGVKDGRDVYVGTAFRSDWVVEEFLQARPPQVVGANQPESLEAVATLYEVLGREVERVPSIREAEVLENARRSFRFAATGFVNQLSLCYRDVNMKRLARLLMSGVSVTDCGPNMGAGGYKEPFAVQNLLDGADSSKYFKVLIESQSVNYTMPIYYAQALMRAGVGRVALLGLTFTTNRRDLTLSPAVSLAKCLMQGGVKVLVNEPVLDTEILSDIVPGAEVCGVEEAMANAEALVLMTNHRAYRAISEAFVLEHSGSDLRFVLDNTGLWSRFQFPKSVSYHEVGDGTLNLIT